MINNFVIYFVKGEKWYSSTFHSGANDFGIAYQVMLVKFSLVHFPSPYNLIIILVLV